MNNYKKYFFIIITLCITLTLFASQGILNVNLKVIGSNNGMPISVEADSINLTAGTLKEASGANVRILHNELTASFFDTNNGLITTVTFENPLSSKQDYVIDSTGELKAVTVQTSSSSAAIRANYLEEMDRLVISGLNDGNRIELGTIDVSGYAIDTATDGSRNQNQFEVIKIIDNGPTDKRINFVILGDGYTASEQSKFESDARSVADYVFTQEPYPAYKAYFNVFAVKVISNQSGAALNPNNLIDNYFGSSFGVGGIDRLLVPTKSSKVYQVLQDHVPAYDQGLVIVNTTKYGGSGGAFATSSMNTSATEIMVHEIGHSFAKLADEYWAGPQYANEKANMTRDTNPSTVRWKQFLNQGGVGIYPHEEDRNWQRPHQGCKMRYLGRVFCLVCQDTHIKKIKSLVPNLSTPTPTQIPQTPTPTVTPTPTATPTATPVYYNAALGKTVVASGQYSTQYPKTAVNDGTTATVWGSLYNAGPQWFYIDLGKSELIEWVTINQFNPYFAPHFYVGVSDDAVNWAFAVDHTGSIGGKEKFTISRSARYVGVYLTGGAMNVYGVSEFEVFVKDSIQVTPTPEPTPTATPTIPGIDPWVAGKAYSVGDQVTYGGKTWRCVTEHVSNAGWYPGAPGVYLWREV